MSHEATPELAALAEQMRAEFSRHIKSLPIPQVVLATITDVTTGPPAFVSVLKPDPTGQAEPHPNVRYASSYSPTVGDKVICFQLMTDFFVLDKFQP